MKVCFKVLCIHSKQVYVAVVFIVIVCICVCHLINLQKTTNTYNLLDYAMLHDSDVDLSLRSGMFLSSGQLLQKSNEHIVIRPDSVSHIVNLSLMFQSDEFYGEKVYLDFDLFSVKEANITVKLKQYSNSREIINETFFPNYKKHSNIKAHFHHNDSTLLYILDLKIACDNAVLLKNVNIRIDNNIINRIFACNYFNHEYNIDWNLPKIELDDFDNIAVDRLYIICKLWGFLKYYHPNVNQGFYDWDKELLYIISKTINISDYAHFQNELWEWTNSLNYNIIPNSAVNNVDMMLYKKDFSWINSNLLDERLTLRLMEIRKMNRNFKYNYYINPSLSKCSFFEREAKYENVNYSDLSTRLLSFFRFWNFIEYCYPYRCLINGWDKCLTDYMPKIVDVKNKSDFIKQLVSLCSLIKDSHLAVLSKDISLPYNIKRYRLFVDVKATSGDSYLVYKSWHPDVKVGDLILKIDDISTGDLIDSLAFYTPASNRRSLLKKVSSVIFSSDSPKMRITMLRNDRKVAKEICLNINQHSISDYVKTDLEKLFLQGAIYIKASSKIDYVDKYFPDSLASIKGVIIDLRSYPSINMFNYLLSKFSCGESDFALNFYNSSMCPGFYRLVEKSNIRDYCHNGVSDFSGKIVVIVDENTVSHGEFLCMALQCIPNCVVIGSQSAGTIGNTSILQLPGNLCVKYTKVATCYPDLTPVQQVGVKIDHKLELDRNLLMKHEDNLINCAIKIINNE